MLLQMSHVAWSVSFAKTDKAIVRRVFARVDAGDSQELCAPRKPCMRWRSTGGGTFERELWLCKIYRDSINGVSGGDASLCEITLDIC